MKEVVEIKKKLKSKIFDKFLLIDEIISITIVGSFIDKNDLSGISDIEIPSKYGRFFPVISFFLQLTGNCFLRVCFFYLVEFFELICVAPPPIMLSYFPNFLTALIELTKIRLQNFLVLQ